MVTNWNIEQISSDINNQIMQGWQPYGNLIRRSAATNLTVNSVTNTTSNISYEYAQPMVKYEVTAYPQADAIKGELIEFLDNYGK